MWGAPARRTLLGLARSLRGETAAVAVRTSALVRVRREMSSSSVARGPVYTSIVEAVTTALEPAELELVDDSASHAGHSGMKGREAVEVCVWAALCVQSAFLPWLVCEGDEFSACACVW